MVTKFERVMVKLATLGQNPRALTDCSDVIPVPANVRLPPATLPAGKSLRDVEAAVRLSLALSPLRSVQLTYPFTVVYLCSAARRPSPPSRPTPARPPRSHLCKYHLASTVRAQTLMTSNSAPGST